MAKRKPLKQDVNNAQLCRAVMQIQDILEKNNLELVIWQNVCLQKCIFAIPKGGNPWDGVRVSTLKQNK